MKKSLLIAGGVIIILLLVALWMYLLFFGTPKNVEDVFTSFNFGNDEATLPAPSENTNTEEAPVVTVTGKALRQLTTRPVIGFREVQKTPSSTPQVYYAEAGTGHIYSINLLTGEERRISGTTITDASRADFTDDGSYVVIQSGTGRAQKTVVGQFKIDSESISLFTMNDAVDNFTITHSGELLYTVKNAVTSGKVMDLTTQVVRTIFTLPFRDATVIWGSAAADTHYVYPKTSHQLEGFVYVIKGGVLSRLPFEGFGLLATAGSGIVAVSNNQQQTQVARFYNTVNKQIFNAPFTMFPEKCVFSMKTIRTVWCASFVGVPGQEFPDSWYMGDITSRDILFEMKISDDSLTTTNLIDTFTETSRELDATNMSAGASEENLYFINKNDNTLWMYDLAL